MSKQFWGVILVIFAIFVGIYAIGGKKSDTSSSSNSNVAATKHITGTATSGVTLVEYGDFQCPYCGQYYPILKQVEAQYKDQVAFQFRNFPLQNVHQNAFAASRAAEAASLQGKFWEMHDLLYENQTSWSSASDPLSTFKQYAKSIGLNESKFATDYASSKVNDTVNADIAAGTKLEVTGTPSFFIDGKKVEVSGSVESFDKVLKAAIAKKAKENKASSSTQPAPVDTSTATQD